MTHSGAPQELKDQQLLEIAGAEMRVLNTPGHSPGSVCFYVPEANELFSGDTLFQGGPGATGDRSFASFDTIIESFRNDIYPGYKTSAGMDPELLAQFPLAEEGMRAIGVVVWSMFEFETDDALATAAHHHLARYVASSRATVKPARIATAIRKSVPQRAAARIPWNSGMYVWSVS